MEGGRGEISQHEVNFPKSLLRPPLLHRFGGLHACIVELSASALRRCIEIG